MLKLGIRTLVFTATFFDGIVRPKPPHLEDIYIKLKSHMNKLSISEPLWILDFYTETWFTVWLPT